MSTNSPDGFEATGYERNRPEKRTAFKRPLEFALHFLERIRATMVEGPEVDLDQLRAYVRGELDDENTDLVFQKTLRWKNWHNAELEVVCEASRNGEFYCNVEREE